MDFQSKPCVFLLLVLLHEAPFVGSMHSLFIKTEVTTTLNVENSERHDEHGSNPYPVVWIEH